MSKLEKGYGSGGMQAILGDVKTYFEGELAKKAKTSDLGTAAYKNSTNQVSSGSTALVESGAVKTALDGKISTSNTPGHVMNDGTIDPNTYAKENEIEGLEAYKLDVESVATSVNGTSSHSPKPFAVNDLLTFGGKLYRVIEAIALDDPVVFSGASANVTETTIEAEMVKKSDADYVHKTGNEDIAGNKHFTGDVIVDGNIIGKKGTIYGFHIDNTEDDPDEKITYMYDAVGMKPAKMNFTTGKFDYGSWENAFFMPRPCMLKFDGTVDYYLNPNDYSKKEDGTASDVADLTYGANAMMEWGRDGKKIWVKIESTSSDKKSANILIADYQVDSNYKVWSFINNQGDLVDHFYTAIYKGSLDSNNRMRSISGQDYTNYVNNKTRQEEVTLAEANNPSTDKLWYTDLKCDRDLINFLTLLMFKSTDIQAKLGEGRTGYSWAQSNVATTGIMNDKGLFYGESSSTGLGCKLFGREQPYGDIWLAEAGFLNVNGTPKTKLTYGTQDGSTAVGYNFDGTGYTAIDVTLPSASANYIGEMIYDSSYGMIPVATGGNEHIDYCDTLWTNNSQTNYALRGGALDGGRRCGAFCLHLSAVAGARDGNVGAALSCKPLA